MIELIRKLRRMAVAILWLTAFSFLALVALSHWGGFDVRARFAPVVRPSHSSSAAQYAFNADRGHLAIWTNKYSQPANENAPATKVREVNIAWRWLDQPLQPPSDPFGVVTGGDGTRWQFSQFGFWYRWHFYVQVGDEMVSSDSPNFPAAAFAKDPDGMNYSFQRELRVPGNAVAGAIIGVMVMSKWRSIKRWFAHRRNIANPIGCTSCHYDLRGSLDSANCPECGTWISDAQKERVRAELLTQSRRAS